MDGPKQNGRYGYRFYKHKELQEYREKVPLPQCSYWLYVPYIATLGQYQLENIGVPTEGYNQELGYPNMYRLTLVKWDLDIMLDCFRAGHKIEFSNKQDIFALVDIIDNYFIEINKIIESPDRDNYVFDDRLEDLDRLVEAIYKSNRGKILVNRREVIEKATLQAMFPGMVLKDLNTISEYDARRVRNGTSLDVGYGAKAFGRYGNRPQMQSVNNQLQMQPPVAPPQDNPLEFQLERVPTINMDNINYKSRYIDPKERRLANEYDYIKRKQYERINNDNN